MSTTYLPKVKDTRRVWHELDASEFTLGRLATRAATLLRGKHKAIFTPHMDLGDFVVVKNASKVKLTGRKLEQKEYIRFTGYPGGIRRKVLRDVLKKDPQWVIIHAVRNMLPTNRLRSVIIKRLKVVPGDKHNYKIS